MATYSVLLLPDHVNGGFTVEVPFLPGVVTEGNTREEALTNAKDAIALMIEDLLADGEEVPSEDAPPELDRVEIDIPLVPMASIIQPFVALFSNVHQEAGSRNFTIPVSGRTSHEVLIENRAGDHATMDDASRELFSSEVMSEVERLIA